MLRKAVERTMSDKASSYTISSERGSEGGELPAYADDKMYRVRLREL
jgi:hypothetical protein